MICGFCSSLKATAALLKEEIRAQATNWTVPVTISMPVVGARRYDREVPTRTGNAVAPNDRLKLYEVLSRLEVSLLARIINPATKEIVHFLFKSAK